MSLLSYFHFSFTVSDIEQSVDFYGNKLGLKLVHRMIHDQAYTSTQIAFANALLKVALFTLPDMPQGQPASGHLLELIEYANPPGEPTDTSTNRPGAAHLAFQTDDIHADFERLQSLGVRMKSDAPVKITHGRHTGGWTCYMLDPDNITLEMVQLPVPFTPEDLP